MQVWFCVHVLGSQLVLVKHAVEGGLDTESMKLQRENDTCLFIAGMLSAGIL